MRPRPYLSYSQMILVEKNPEAYLDVYLHGKKIPINRGMALGRDIAEALESNIATGDPVKDIVMAQLPKYALMDKPIEAILGTGKSKIPLLAKPDTCMKDYSAFREYKTGLGPWNQEKADSWPQITFYAVVLYLITGKIPEAELVWMKTEKDEIGQPVFSHAEPKIFKTQRAMRDILLMQVRMRKAWQKIGEICDKELL